MTAAGTRLGGAITGVIVVDLTDLDRWTNEGDQQARVRLAVIADAPAGCTVVIRTGTMTPPMFGALASVAFHRVDVVIEAAEPRLIRRWISEIRGDAEVIA